MTKYILDVDVQAVVAGRGGVESGYRNYVFFWQNTHYPGNGT